MTEHRIVSLGTRDVRFPLPQGAGSDAVHSGTEYALATTLLASDRGVFGTGIVLTFGQGNQLVCQAIELIGEAATAADAVAMSRDRAPDVVLMDLQLPDGNGIDGTRTFRGPQRPLFPSMSRTLADTASSTIAACSPE